MAKTIKSSFDEYATNLILTDRQESLILKCQSGVVKTLKDGLSLHQQGSIVIGSWARNTMTRFLSEGDVDLMVILHYNNNKKWNSSDGTINALDKFKAILDEAYPNTLKRRDRNCITMQFSQFRLDVVPAFKCVGDYYKIPDSVRKCWLITDPICFANKVTSINKAMDNSFIPLIRMIKGWNREVGWPIRSFHLECMMIQRYQRYSKKYTYDSMLRCFFESLPKYIRGSCYDPIKGDRVDTYLDNNAVKTKRTIAIEKAEAAAKDSKLAIEMESRSLSEAIRLWKSLLGGFFPQYG